MRRGRASAAMALLLPCLLRSAPLRAADEYVILGAGGRPCGLWLQVRNQPNPESTVLQSWVLGYITSINANVLTKSQDITGGDAPEVLYSWIDSYCAEHPLDSLARATQSLLTSLRSKSKAH